MLTYSKPAVFQSVLSPITLRLQASPSDGGGVPAVLDFTTQEDPCVGLSENDLLSASIFNVNTAGFMPTQTGTLRVQVCGDLGNPSTENYVVSIESVTLSPQLGSTGDCTCDSFVYNLGDFFTLEQLQNAFADGTVQVSVAPQASHDIQCLTSCGSGSPSSVEIEFDIQGLSS